jgi:hypothetical protein
MGRRRPADPDGMFILLHLAGAPKNVMQFSLRRRKELYGQGQIKIVAQRPRRVSSATTRPAAFWHMDRRRCSRVVAGTSLATQPSLYLHGVRQ